MYKYVTYQKNIYIYIYYIMFAFKIYTHGFTATYCQVRWLAAYTSF